MSTELNEVQRVVLHALCDTFVPSIQAEDDPTGFWARSASDMGVPQVLAQFLINDAPEDLRTPLLQMLNDLAAKDFANADQGARENILHQIYGSSRPVERLLSFFEKQSMLLNYGLPAGPGSDENAVTYGSPEGQNPNWAVMGYPGPVTVPRPDKPRAIQPFIPQGDNLSMETDVCVVGSGAGGAVIAARMAAAGRNVVILEAGGYYTSSDFHQLELWGYKHLWYRGGATPTGNGDVTLLAGGTLGGGTEINWMNCVRTPDLVRQDWVRNFGLDGVDTADFARYLDIVEARIMASSQTAYYNSQNLRMREGCARLGYLSKQTKINWDPRLFQPLLAGFTGFGDQTGGKQTARRTYVLDAYRSGARIIVNCQANRILVENARATTVEATYSDPNGRHAKLSIRAQQIVVACGALESPALLLRSGIGGPAVGRHLHVQPGGAVYGVYREKQKGWWGSPMTTNCEQFTDTGGGYGFYMEIPAFGPGFVASVIPWAGGRQHKEVMTKVPHISTFIWFLRDRGSGKISIDGKGNSVSEYALTDDVDQQNFRHATAEAIRIHEAAGAEDILISLAHQQLAWKRGQDIEQFIGLMMQQPLLNGAQPMISAHQLSSCRMGNDPAESVANPNGELHDVKGVWVGDASACPTALGANPMVTIMALAERTSDRMIASSSRGDFHSTAFPNAVPRDFDFIPGMAMNMFREMMGLAANPAEMFREMAGMMTNPANMIQFSKRLFMGSSSTAYRCGGCGMPGTPQSATCAFCGNSVQSSRTYDR